MSNLLFQTRIIIEIVAFLIRSSMPVAEWVQGMFAITITTIITIIITVILSYSLQT